MNAEKGSALGVMMKVNKKELYPEDENYGLIGDATAIPVIGTILGNLADTAKGIYIIHVHSKEDEQHLQTKANIQFHSLFNSNPQKNIKLHEAVIGVALPE
jgi:NADPH-dependent ferric siderophore reductase